MFFLVEPYSIQTRSNFGPGQNSFVRTDLKLHYIYANQVKIRYILEFWQAFEEFVYYDEEERFKLHIFGQVYFATESTNWYYKTSA